MIVQLRDEVWVGEERLVRTFEEMKDLLRDMRPRKNNLKRSMTARLGLQRREERERGA